MSHSILIVDDSPIMRKMIKRALEVAGVEVDQVFEAGDGHEALRLLECTPVSLVLADINMPTMNGEEMISAMSRSAALSAIPVVVVSSERSPERMDRLRMLGVKGQLPKPFTPEDVHALFSEIVPSAGGRNAT